MAKTSLSKRSAAQAACLASVSALALGSVPALAQTAPAATAQRDDVIIVSARTFEEDLQDVPLAVTVLNAETLERQGLDDLADIAEKTVGFSFESFTGPLAQPSIRGQTNLRVTSPVTNVATYLDGVYIQRAFLIDQGLIDLEQVEIIKGPQSALYGRNAFAGVINLVSRKPNLDAFEGDVRVGAGTDEYLEASGTVSIPLVPGRVALLGHVAYQEFDGTYENSHPLSSDDGCITCGNIGGYEKETYQLGLLAELGDRITLEASYIHTERKQEHVTTYNFGTSGAIDAYNYNNCSPIAAPAGRFDPPGFVQQAENRLYCGELSADPNFVTGAPNIAQGQPGAAAIPDTRPDGFLIDPRAFALRGPTDVATLKLEVEPVDDLTFTYQFGYTYGDIEARGSSGRDPLTPLPAFFGGGALFDGSGSGSEFEGYSNDFRLTFSGSDLFYGFVGANVSATTDFESNVTEVFPVGTLATPGADQLAFPVGPGLPFPRATFQRRTALEREEDIFSVYGFVEVRPSDQLRFSLEGRYTSEERKTTDFLTRDADDPEIQSLNPPVDETTESFFTPRFSASYEFTPDNQIYISAARGVKAGGNNGFVDFVPQRNYAKETNWTYELGSKNLFPAAGLKLNAAVYYTDWQDLQTTEARRLADGSIPTTFFVLSTVTGNVGSVEVYGAEVEGVWDLTDAITFDFGASYNRSRYKDGETSQRFQLAAVCDGIVCPTGEVPIGGNQVERIPEFDSFAGLGYEGDLGAAGDFYLRGDVTYQTKQFVDEANLAWVPDRFLVNAQAGVTLGKISVRAIVQNLLDTDYVANALFLIGTGGARSTSYVPILGYGRTARLTVGYEF